MMNIVTVGSGPPDSEPCRSRPHYNCQRDRCSEEPAIRTQMGLTDGSAGCSRFEADLFQLDSIFAFGASTRWPTDTMNSKGDPLPPATMRFSPR
jgi:hypothetical protein